MSSLFDFDSEPDRYAVMGNPVGHSKSPQIHAEFARQTGQHMVYSKIQVDIGGLAQAVGNFHANGGKGLNITLPFKRDAWALVDERSERAEQAGAVNTILFRPDDSSYGDNTDGAGLIRDITFNHRFSINDKRVLILGAGGAVRGLLGPLLAEQPRNIVIANRTIETAIALATEFSSTISIKGCGFTMLEGEKFDLVINGTSAGLKGIMPPVPASVINDACLCYDMLYGDKPTAFIRWAHENGAAKAADGIGMLVEQAAESFQLWRNVRPDTNKVIEKLRSGTL